MTVLSVDLAYRRYRDIGVTLLSEQDEQLDARFIRLSLCSDPDPDVLSETLANLASDLGATLLLIDGPQGWKCPNNGLIHSRVCERALNTPAKTGLPSNVKPANYRPFTQFSVALYDSLHNRGWPRLRKNGDVTNVTIETFPFAAWKALGLRPLPAKSKTTPDALRDRLDCLLSTLPVRLQSEPNHDELQSLVAGVAGLAIARGSTTDFYLYGDSPHLLNGTYREGYIACPLLKPKMDGTK